jgi:hypothetical protein
VPHHRFDDPFPYRHLTTQAIQFGFGFTDGFVGRALLPFITHVIILHEEQGFELKLS